MTSEKDYTNGCMRHRRETEGKRRRERRDHRMNCREFSKLRRMHMRRQEEQHDEDLDLLDALNPPLVSIR